MAIGKLSFSFNPDLPYMTPSEADAFKRLRECGRLSFFRTTVCKAEGCDNEVIKGKSYCSKRCYDGNVDSGSGGQRNDR